MNCSEHFFNVLGKDAMNGSSLAQKGKGDMIDFMVTNKKEKHYLEYCNDVVLPNDPVGTINKYTDHPTQLFAKVNLALASDSPVIKEQSQFIQQLRASIIDQPLFDDGFLYRGCDFSEQEVIQMEKLKSFFIPSFTSTSVDKDKAYQKNSLLVIKTPYCCKYSCSITPKLSKYYNQEKEVLISCYSAYRLEKIEKVSNTKVITLFLDEHLSGLFEV